MSFLKTKIVCNEIFNETIWTFVVVSVCLRMICVEKGTTQAPEEDHGVLIIITLIVVSFLICLLCTLCHSKRKRRAHVRQLGLHRNAHYDSQTSATGKLLLFSTKATALQAAFNFNIVNFVVFVFVFSVFKNFYSIWISYLYVFLVTNFDTLAGKVQNLKLSHTRKMTVHQISSCI